MPWPYSLYSQRDYSERAQQLRAEAMSAFLADILTGLRRWRLRHKVRARLERLEPRLLDDIGVEPWAIAAHAARVALARYPDRHASAEVVSLREPARRRPQAPRPERRAA